jgi:hypothetical protein
MQEMPLVLTIRNDRTGTARKGSYDITLAGPQLFVQVRVENYDRARGWWQLLEEAVKTLESQKGRMT